MITRRNNEEDRTEAFQQIVVSFCVKFIWWYVCFVNHFFKETKFVGVSLYSMIKQKICCSYTDDFIFRLILSVKNDLDVKSFFRRATLRRNFRQNGQYVISDEHQKAKEVVANCCGLEAHMFLLRM